MALIIIYNHQYNQNIDILEKIYKNRFSHIYHLMPFYCGEKSNVIPVYENSHYFQGYVAQGLKSYFKEEYAHYFFISDDLILNPIINEDTYTDHFKLNRNTCFLPRLDTLHKTWKSYNIKPQAAARYSLKTPGIEVKNQLPDYNTALRLLGRYGIQIKPLYFHQIVKPPSDPIRNFIYKTIKLLLFNKKYHLSYPLTSSYSDIFVVSAATIKQFCHYCGVFAATNLFVEVGLPTAMALSAQEITLEKDLILKGQTLWTKDECKILDPYHHDLNLLMKNFPAELLYLHPIKLSEWRLA